MAGGYAQFRAEIEPELAAQRLKPLAPEEKGNLLNPQRRHWKRPKDWGTRRPRKPYGHHDSRLEKRKIKKK